MFKQTFKNIEDSLNDLLKSYNLPDNEYLLRNVTALVENIKIDQEIRKRKAKFKEKKRKKGQDDFLSRLYDLRDKYGGELTALGISIDTIKENIEWLESHRGKHRAHKNDLINSSMVGVFNELRKINVNAKKQWDFVYDLFCKYSMEIETDENNGADYYERIKAVYKEYR